MLMSVGEMYTQQGHQDTDDTEPHTAASVVASHRTREPRRWLLRVTRRRNHSTKNWLSTQCLLPSSEACHDQSQGSQDWGTFMCVTYLRSKW